MMTSHDSRAVREIMQRAAGAENVSDEASASHSIDGQIPALVVFPNDIQELSRVMAAAWEQHLSVAPWGGGTRTELGNPLERLDIVVDLSRLDRVVRHNPADLTATVEAGVTISALQGTLAQETQFLAVDPPLPDRATIGGTLATAVSGPMKWQFGNPRDIVVGMRTVQADGTITKSGGEVVKNVSGYDMARLHIGGLGTLGVIADVSLKLMPLPPGERTLVAVFDETRQCLDAGLGIFHSSVSPLALASFDDAVNRRGRVLELDGNRLLAVRLGGRPLALRRQVDECASLFREHGAKAVEPLDRPAADAMWRGIADFGWHAQTIPVMAGRVSVLPTEVSSMSQKLERLGDDDLLHPAVITHPGYGTALIHWFADAGYIPNDRTEAVLRQALDCVHDAGGRMVIERCPIDLKQRFDVWDDVGEPLAIMRRMKEQYDPRRILNPGRFAGRI